MTEREKRSVLSRAWTYWCRRAPRQRVWGVVGLAVAGVLLERTERAVEYRYVLQYLAFATVSLFASWWFPQLVMNATLGIAWLVVSAAARLPTVIQLVVIFLNRQLGHLEALFAWVILTIAFVPWLWLKLPLAGALVLFGPMLIDRLVVRLRRRRGAAEGPPTDENTWDHYFARRPAIYVVTALGFLLLFALAWSQRAELGPFAAAIGVGILLRVATLVNSRRGGAPATGERVKAGTVAMARLFDRTFAIAVIATVLAVMIASVVPTELRRQRDFAHRWRQFLPVGGEASGRRTAVAGRPGAAAEEVARLGPLPGRVDLTLFLVADTQLHELRGERSGAHMDLLDSLVPVSVRPVELDLLSGATLDHFAVTWRRVQGERRARGAGGALAWAYLGDLADLGCADEMLRMRRHLAGFGPDLAAIIPGNHDSTFAGNFAWHPDWEKACRPSGAPREEARMTRKAAADRLLHETARALAPGVAWSPPVPHPLSAAIGAPKTIFAQVRVLGRHRGEEVVGVFLDSTDYTSAVLGIAGVQGAISSLQRDVVLRRLAEHPRAWVIVFLHHTMEELSRLGRGRLDEIARAARGRVLGVVAAHTHVAALRGVELDGRRLPELIVPSTTDPPQEAAILELGQSGAGHSALRLTTIPSVGRADARCEAAASDVSAADCAAALGPLKARCPELFAETEPIVEGAHPSSPEEVKAEQQVRARRLLRCIYRDAGPVPDAPLDDAKLFERLDAFVLGGAGGDARRRELVCLGWAASVLQRNKRDGWGYAQALGDAFSGAAVQPAVEMAFDVDAGTGGARACRGGP